MKEQDHDRSTLPDRHARPRANAARPRTGCGEVLHEFSQAVFADGALSTRTKHIIAVAVAHVTQCPYCIRGHTRAAVREGVSGEELMEAIWVAAEMRAGAAFAHSVLALDEMEREMGTGANGHSAAGHGADAHHPG